MVCPKQSNMIVVKDFGTIRNLSWTNRKIKLITHLYCSFSIFLRSLSLEMLYCLLYYNRKYCHSSSEAYVESWQMSMIERFCEYSKELEAVNCFRKKDPSNIFERFLITPR